jgi:hypoxanthine phosphoribosyltransferase
MRDLVMSEKEILEACAKLGEQISNDLKDEEKVPLIIGVMKGGIPFMMDLIKYISIPVMTDFIQVSSYTGTSRSREVKLVKDLTFNIEGRTIILVDDVVDSGNSLLYLVNHLYNNYKPKKVLTCALFDKVNAREADIEVDYSGKLLTENKFLCGYGLDYLEIYRNVPYVFIPTEEELEEIQQHLKAKGEI